MDMAIGRKYLKLLADRFLFQRVSNSKEVFKQRRIRVHNCIHDMAVYIGQTEENCLFMANQNQQKFPEVHDKNCTRISAANNSMKDLPTQLRFPNLASLSLEGNGDLKELPSEFLLSVTSLRVLNLSGCTQITSIPMSIGQLRLLQSLSLKGLPIKKLPEQVCNLSSLQFLDLSSCRNLHSLPSQIGELISLKHFNLVGCKSLKIIPHEMSELISLSKLQLGYDTPLSVEMEARASIWGLKGLKNLRELQIWIDTRQPDGKRLRISDGIMGTWSEMRHLQLRYHDSYEEDLPLPDDMQNMKKLQSFMLYYYGGLSLLSLQNCKFELLEHLQMVKLYSCDGIRELYPLERLPNLKILKLEECYGLKELGIGIPSGYVRLQKLVLKDLGNLECLGGASKITAWDDRTVPNLRVLKLGGCPFLKRFPKGMEKLPNLLALIYQPILNEMQSADEWWKSLMWQDDSSKGKLQKIFIPRQRVSK